MNIKAAKYNLYLISSENTQNKICMVLELKIFRPRCFNYNNV